ncbi:MAG: sigma-70 family RNA polymerase sigma factor [Bacteroidota bacterium]
MQKVVNHRDLDDRSLASAFRNGDEMAFEELVRRYHRQVANIIYLTLGSRKDVEDLAQDVFVRVHGSLRRVSVETTLFSWIYRIAVNIAIDEVRRRKIRKIVSMDFLAEPGGTQYEPRDPGRASDRVLAGEKREQILAALQRLSPAHRAALVLREYEDLSYAEIAETLGISEQAVKSRIFRAREEMKRLLKDYFRERT